MLVWARRFILKTAHPILAWAASRHRVPLMTAEFVDKAFASVMPGDVLVTRIEGNLANHLIPGFYTHAAMYLGKNLVIESTGEGVKTKHLAKFLFDKDRVAILRPLFADPTQMAHACDVAKGLEGDPYDYDFTGDNRAWYCSEIIWYSYDQAVKPAVSPFTRRETWGVETVVPQDFYLAKTKFSIIELF